MRFRGTKNDDGRLQAEGHTAGRNVYEHQYQRKCEHEIETALCDWKMGHSDKEQSSESADGEFRSGKVQVAVLDDTGHESVAFGRDAEDESRDS
jgi:hypothetical protein